MLIIPALLAGCGNQTSNTTANSNIAATSPTPLVSPTKTEEEQEKAKKERDDEIQISINDFIAKNYKGWQYEGISNGAGECEEYSPYVCDLLLSNGRQEKVVAVKFKRFFSNDGESRLVVYEARQIDLTKAKIEEIKQSAIDNLDIEQISDEMKDAIVENAND